MNLPTELWIDILKGVVHVPGYNIMHTDLPYQPSPYFDDPRTETLNQAISASILTKLTLLRVCKLWYSIIEELLFEVIVIFRPEQLHKVADVLTRNPLQGIFVRRIDLRLRDSSLSHISAETMEAIIKPCINLEVFIDGKSCYQPVQYDALDLLARHAKKLRHFSFPIYGKTHQTFGGLVRCASQLTRLELLWLPDIDVLEQGESIVSSLSLPSLHSLAIEIDILWGPFILGLAQWNLPSLANVRLMGSRHNLMDPTPFFEVHGHKIKVLTFAVTPPGLETILDTCSSTLVTLIYPFDSTAKFNLAIKSMPKLCILGVWIPPYPYPTYPIADHFEDLTDAYFHTIRTRLPAVKEITFIDCASEFELDRWSKKRLRIWKKHQLRWHNMGIPLAVPGGRLFPGTE